MQPEGFWRIPGELLLCPDHRGRADIPAYRWIHWHHPQEGELSETECELTHPILACIVRCNSVPPHPCFLQKQSKDRFGLEADEEATMLEESVSPKKWVIFMYCAVCCIVRSHGQLCLFRLLIMHVIRFLPAQHRTPRTTIVSFKTALWMLEHR